jgi:heme exporter protein C
MFAKRKPMAWTTPIWLLGAFIVLVTTAVTLVAPQDSGMGDSQRIVYLHVSVAWIGLMSFILMAGFGALYLRSRDLGWDAWAQSAAEIGWLSCTLTLVSGSLWAQQAWGTWWTWDPRLTTFLILWMLLTGAMFVRESIPRAHRRARTCAVLAAIGLLDIPLVTMATRWFRGIHPVSPEMDPIMRYVLAATVITFTAYFGLLLVQRGRQLQ